MNRARIAERAAANPRIGSQPRNRGTVSTDPAARIVSIQRRSTARIRRGKTRYSGSGDAGYRSEWSRSMTFRNAVTVDARWSK